MLEHVRPLGVTWRVLQGAHASGRLTRLAQGVYVATDALPADDIGQHVLRARAHQLLMPDAVASHGTAALAWGIALVHDVSTAAGPVVFTRPMRADARSRRGEGLVLHVGDLPPRDRVPHPSGLLVTTPARAGVEVAAGLALPEALVTLDAAARILLQERVGRSWLRDDYTKRRSVERTREHLADAATRVGTHLNRRSLDLVLGHADPRRESPAESLSYGHMMLAGLPSPELQVQLSDDLGDMYVDFLWRSAGLVGEVDGNAKYRTTEDLIAERRREARIKALGWRIVRWEAVEILSRPLAVMHRLDRMLQAG